MQSKVNLLVVDDQQANLVAMEALLAHPQATVLKASSGDEALDLLLRHDVGLALLDVNMPEMDGFELAEIMRSNAQTRSIPIIFITAAMLEPSKAFAGYQAGAVDFLYKPLDPLVLLSKVSMFIELNMQKKQLAEQVAQLEEALKLNEMFVAVLGHDLRTPLSAVQHGAEAISRLENASQIQRVAKLMLSSTQRMNEMVNQLLDAARARATDVALELCDSDYQAVAQHVVDELKSSKGCNHIVVTSEGTTSARFDRTRMLQVFSNLLANAVQHGAAGETIAVHLNGSHPHKVVLTVSNQGLVPSAIMDRIFDPFHSGPVARRSNAGGLGLGLFIVKRFVQAHHGEVTVCSKDGYTAFEVTVPRFSDSGLALQ